MIEYRTMDKSAWGAGPWQNEPDKAQWIDEATGYDCLIVRNNLGALCGYAGVPKGHPLHGASYSGLDINVHGGLTFASGCRHSDDPAKGICHIPQDGRPDDVWWFGFDCSHAGDLSPAFNTRNRIGGYGDVYADFEYVKRDCEHLASQLKVAASLQTPSPELQNAPATVWND